MMGERAVRQESLFYGFNLDDHVPADHLLRSINRFVELSSIRRQLAPYYSAIDRPRADDPRAADRLLLRHSLRAAAVRGGASQPGVSLFCRLDLTDPVPDHSTFSKNRHGRFRDSDLLRTLFEATVRRCMAEGIVGGQGFAVDASMIRADAHRQKGVASPEELDPENTNHAVTEYLAVLDDAAFGAATEVAPQVHLADRPRRALDGSRRWPGLLRLLRQRPDRRRACCHRGCRGHHGRAPGRGRCRADPCSPARPSGSASGPSA
jgi:transposase